MSDYEQPDKGEKFAPSDHPEWLGKLFLFWPEGVETVNFTRPDGSLDPTDMVTCDVAIIDLPDPENGGRPKFLKGARVGGAALAPQVKKKIGKKVLGRLKQAPRQGNKSGAFYLEDWTPQDVQLAQAYEAQFPRNAYDAPSGGEPAPGQWGGPPPASTPPPAAPAQGGWGQPPAAPPAAPPAPAQQQWGAPPAAPPAPPADPFPGAPGLADFLRSRGVDVTGMDEGTARQLAATMPQQ